MIMTYSLRGKSIKVERCDPNPNLLKWQPNHSAAKFGWRRLGKISKRNAVSKGRQGVWPGRSAKFGVWVVLGTQTWYAKDS